MLHSRRLPTLDGWRAIAILAVLSTHIRWPTPALLKLGQYGPMGVHLFFALSGFLITTRLLEERQRSGRINWKNFYIRRAFRILPPAFLYLAVIAILGIGLHIIPTSWSQLAASAFFYRNYLTPVSPEPWYTAHFWSLAVEEHFYLLWPLILALSRFRKATVLAPLLAIAVGLWRALDQHYNWVAALDPLLKDSVQRTDYRLDILLFGCAAALLWSHAWVRNAVGRIAGSAAVAAILLATVACLYWQPPAYLSLLAVLMALLPVATVARPESIVGRLLETPVLKFIGRISYSLYLWQQLFLPVFGVQPAMGWIQSWPWNLIAAFGIAVLSYYFVEGPSIACGKTLERRRPSRLISNGSMRFGCILTFLMLSLRAQLIPTGTPIPMTAKPPIVFLNGYQESCSGSSFAGTFGVFDQLFQDTNRVTLFFDNCAYSGKPPIEQLGSDFAAYLASLKYTDGTPVPQVDVVAHSMGGLIVRCYLAGKQTASGVFDPPATPAIRKMVFLAVPNFGSPIATLLGFGLDAQAEELANGTIFSFDLGTWNQGTDDLRGVDALAAAGNGGTGLTTMPGFDDGVVSLTSASIAFAGHGRTRIIPYCHTDPGLVTLAGLCPPNAPGIADAVAASDENAALVLSFLNDTTAWQSIGQAAEQNSFLSTGGGLEARAKSATDQYLTIQSATASSSLTVQTSAVAWIEYLPAQLQDLVITTPSETLQDKFTLPAGYTSAVTVKDGPLIARVLPSAAAVFPLAVAPGEIVSIYGTNLAASQLTIGGAYAAIDYNGPSQINAIVPDTVQGLVPFSVTNATGSHTVNVLIQPAVPAIYTQDQSGAGPAAALNGVTNVLVTASAPLHPGDYVSLYLTGLGSTTNPTVTVGGQPCPVTYAGNAPGFPGLNQINCQIPAIAASSAAPVYVTAAGRTSNEVTLDVM